MAGYEGETVHLGLRCPLCRGEMEEGFVPDHAHGTVVGSRWMRGRPKRSLLTGIKVRGERAYPIVTYRCLRCGFLASFAGAGGAS
jgi:hypothetical protein